MKWKKLKTAVDWKALGKRLLWPPIWLTVVLVPVAAAALIAVFVYGLEENPVVSPIYVLAAYTLTAVCAHFARAVPRWKNSLLAKVHANPIGDRLLTDHDLRDLISLYCSLAISLAYSIFKVTAGFLYESYWLGTVAVYYAGLALMRFLVLHSMRREKDLKTEYRRYRLIGWLLMLLDIPLGAIVFFMVWWDRGYSYPGYLIFIVAAYAFYSVTISIRDLIRYRRSGSPVLSAAKCIRFVAALVSLLTMETAMLAQFGEDIDFARLTTALTGMGICAVTFCLSVVMVVRANIAIKKLEGES